MADLPVPQEHCGKLKKLSSKQPLRGTRYEFSLSRALDLRRFFMPNIDKVVKTVMHEVAEGKVAVRETMCSVLKNQEIVIAQNKCITNLLAEINNKLSMISGIEPDFLQTKQTDDIHE